MARRTPHQQAITQVITDAPGPLSADEVRNRLRDTGVGVATVYRALKAGVESGVFQPVDIPHSPTRYEPASRPHHHHFQCDACDCVYDLPGCPGDLDRLLPQGFSLDRHDILLHGICETCQPTKEAA